MQTITVVGALCIRGDHLLITCRPPHKTHGGLWEFPGGKVEPGEDHRVALQRELQEELALEVQVGGLTHRVSHRYEGFAIDLWIYRCEVRGEPQLVEATDARWVLPAELAQFSLTPADVPVARDLRERGIPSLKDRPLSM